jgi:hypothetical protein
LNAPSPVHHLRISRFLPIYANSHLPPSFISAIPCSPLPFKVHQFALYPVRDCRYLLSITELRFTLLEAESVTPVISSWQPKKGLHTGDMYKDIFSSARAPGANLHSCPFSSTPLNERTAWDPFPSSPSPRVTRLDTFYSSWLGSLAECVNSEYVSGYLLHSFLV